MKRILITGGAGFIGSRLARRLLEEGHEVRILDSFVPQVHGPEADAAPWMRDACDVRRGDMADAGAVQAAVDQVDAVVHLAAETGPAQSMYEIARYSQANLQGTALLLQELLPLRDRLQALVVASSRAVYGEGKYICRQDGAVYPDPRPDERLRAGEWEPVCPVCGEPVQAVATDEDALPKPTSIYAVTKLGQEQMCLAWGRAYGVATSALRYQNVYGPGQSLTNPYIGVLAIFAARIKSGSVIQVYEDGRESRDFVHVDDAVEGTCLALDRQGQASGIYNVGSGEATSLAEVAARLCEAMGRQVPLEVSGRYRVGDIRHCYADLSRSTAALGYRPRVSLPSGLQELARWTWQEDAFSDRLEQATGELTTMGLFREGKR